MLNVKSIIQSKNIINEQRQLIEQQIFENIIVTYLDILGIKSYTREEYKNILTNFYNEMKINKEEYLN